MDFTKLSLVDVVTFTSPGGEVTEYELYSPGTEDEPQFEYILNPAFQHSGRWMSSSQKDNNFYRWLTVKHAPYLLVKVTMVGPRPHTRPVREVVMGCELVELAAWVTEHHHKDEADCMNHVFVPVPVNATTTP